MYFGRPMDRVIDGLYIGSMYDYSNPVEFSKNNITHIIDLASNTHSKPNLDLIKSNTKYIHFEIQDVPEAPIELLFDICYTLIDEVRDMGGRVLVNCYAGRSRSATIVMYYIMTKYIMGLSEVFNLVAAQRPIIAPNLGFMTKLGMVEKNMNIV